jgi:hypothetical protein
LSVNCVRESKILVWNFHNQVDNTDLQCLLTSDELKITLCQWSTPCLWQASILFTWCTVPEEALKTHPMMYEATSNSGNFFRAEVISKR